VLQRAKARMALKISPPIQQPDQDEPSKLTEVKKIFAKDGWVEKIPTTFKKENTITKELNMVH
jgi:hypothetical protein